MRGVGNFPDMSAEVSGGTSGGVSGGFKICMYGKSGGFASRPSLARDFPTNPKWIFMLHIFWGGKVWK
jgi:hypothetical protein